MTRNDAALYLAVCYLMLGVFLTCYALEPSVYAALGRWGTYVPFIFAVLSGFVWGKLHAKPLLANTDVSMLGGLIKLGNGTNAIFASMLLAFAIASLCYWLGGLGLFVGLSFGCSAGMFLGWLFNQSSSKIISPAPQPV